MRNTAEADSESVEELAEEGNFFEANAVEGVLEVHGEAAGIRVIKLGNTPGNNLA